MPHPFFPIPMSALISTSSQKKSSMTIIECPPPLLTVNGKRRGRKPGANSTLAQRSAANSRERSRMRVLSSAFIDLKGALPWVPKDTKLSKLDTLKLAAGYIAYLKGILVEDITGTGTHLPPPWSVYDIYSPHAMNSSNKSSASRVCFTIVIGLLLLVPFSAMVPKSVCGTAASKLPVGSENDVFSEYHCSFQQQSLPGTGWSRFNESDRSVQSNAILLQNPQQEQLFFVKYIYM